MNNQEHDMIPPVEMPKPSAELPTRPYEQITNEVVSQVAIEQGRTAPHNAPQNPVQPQVLSPQQPLPSSPQAAPATPSSAASSLTAEDADLIEKEWVERAKHIVEQTKADPYLQNKEMTKFRAEYLKKRFDKDIKISQE